MVFQYQPSIGFDYMKEFAKRFGLSSCDGFIEFASSFGNGFIKTIDIEEGFRIVINKMDFKRRLVIKKKAADAVDDLLVFRFKYIIASDRNYLSNVQVINNACQTEDVIEANTSACYLVVSIRSGKLLKLIDLEQGPQELASFVSHFNNPLLYQEIMTPEMKNIIRELLERKNLNDRLEKFYYKTKISELIYEFFSRFLRRTTLDFGSIHQGDIEKILHIEKMILEDFGKVPVLSALARTIGMSETKMKSLFKKIFEDSIYNYYSSARMVEAASILKNDRHIPVSEVGYSLGFSNLSHFSKMFKRHIGMNPKEYALSSKNSKQQDKTRFALRIKNPARENPPAG